MKNIKYLFLFLIFCSFRAHALPKHIELWFLSIDKTAWLDSIIQEKVMFQKTAQKKLSCQQIGEFCFDPQVGLYKREGSGKIQGEIDMMKIEKSQKYDFIKPHEGIERSLIECDENSNFFDVFCGKSKKLTGFQQTKLEVWIDVSSTMRQIDFEGFTKPCKREQFLRALGGVCTLNQKMKVYSFDEHRQEVGSLDRVCISSGLNNMKRIVQDIKRSKADNLIIITDIFEAEESFIDAVESTGRSTIKGLKKPLYASNLKEEVKRIQKLCQ